MGECSMDACHKFDSQVILYHFHWSVRKVRKIYDKINEWNEKKKKQMGYFKQLGLLLSTHAPDK